MVNYDPLVSIIVPAYNAEKYIQNTLNCCLNQTHKKIEIIVVNDGSTDYTERIIKGFNEKSIKYFKIKNSGASNARNFGLTKASGKLIQFLDADDLIDSQKIEKQVEKFQIYGDNYIYSSRMGKVQNDVCELELNYDLYQSDFSPLEYYTVVLNQFGKYLTTGSWLIPICLIEATYGWDERCGLNDDGEYLMRLILESTGIIYCGNSFFFYRRDVENSFSKVFDNKSVYEKWLFSYKSYVKHFLEKFPSVIAKELGWKALSVYYCSSYPKYHDLLKDCKRTIKSLGYNHASPYGGKLFRKIANIIGCDNALFVLSIKNRFF